jgi:predicted DNA-binding transcriptional regulator AlpA
MGKCKLLLKEDLYYMDDIVRVTGKPKLTIRRWFNKGIFPKPTMIPGNRLVWKVKIIEKWLNDII